MTSRDFCFWLQGYFEIAGESDIDQKQVEIIKKHLNLTFIHDIDESMGDKDHQDKLNEVHDKPSKFSLPDGGRC